MSDGGKVKSPALNSLSAYLQWRDSQIADGAGDVNQFRVWSAGVRYATLTDAEREAVEWAAYAAQKMYEHTAAATLMDLLKRLGGCPPQLDCGADRKSVASQRCRDTGGQPFESAPITTLTDAEREAVWWALQDTVWSYSPECGDHPDTLRRLLERMK